MNFNDFNINENILDAISDLGFKNPTPIQKLAIPEILKGRDIIGQAQTGSGKTIAFSIPILEKIFIPDKSPQAIILCPTRELCMQVADEINKLSSKMKKIKIIPVYSVQPISKQSNIKKKGVHIVLGTPGRVIDHIQKGNLELIGVESVVLDESDEMLDMGFRGDIEYILSNTPNQRQTLLFSATIPPEIRKLAKKYQKNPKFIKVSDKKENIPNIRQYYFKCDIRDKFDGMMRLIDAYNVKLALIFCNTKKSVDFVKKHMKKQDYSVDSIHGDMSQKIRDKVMNKFRNGNIRILVATDVASRGLDIDDVDVVINYDVPQNHDDYIHRIGRTARAGKDGLAFSLVSKDEVSRFNNISNKNKTKIIQKKIPTLEEIDEIKSNEILSEVKKSIRDDDLDKYVDIINKNSNGEYSDLKIAAGLLKKVRKD